MLQYNWKLFTQLRWKSCILIDIWRHWSAFELTRNKSSYKNAVLKFSTQLISWCLAIPLLINKYKYKYGWSIHSTVWLTNIISFDIINDPKSFIFKWVLMFVNKVNSCSIFFYMETLGLCFVGGSSNCFNVDKYTLYHSHGNPNVSVLGYYIGVLGHWRGLKNCFFCCSKTWGKNVFIKAHVSTIHTFQLLSL